MFQQYFTNDSPSALLTQKGVLAVISFEHACAASPEQGVVPVGFESLSGQAYEVIRYGDCAVERGANQNCHWSIADDLIFVSTWLSPAQCLDIQTSSYNAYLNIYDTLEKHGFPNVFRIWNFLPNINAGEGDDEVYKKFCVGRGDAFDHLGVSENDFPATSCLGNHSDGAVIYLLANKEKKALHYENPKQESAYRYPREYGPTSPSFARATSIDLYQQKNIFISGTASILGHETRAPENIQQQLSITLDNVQTLLAHIDDGAESLLALRVYLRDKVHYDQARAFLDEKLPGIEINYLLADICRSNLLLEMEAASKADKFD